MARTGKIIGAWQTPSMDKYQLEAIVDGVLIRFTVSKAELAALNTKPEKKRFLRDKAAAALDERIASSDLADLLGDFLP